jgi:hypothetical protein
MTKAKLNLKIEHQVKGRIRMKVPSAKGNPELLEQIKQTFGSIPGIQGITVNATTGSVTLLYDEESHAGFHTAIAEHLPEHKPPAAGEYDELVRKIEEEAEFLAEHSQIAREVVEFFKQVDRSLKVATSNLIDLKLVLVIGIAALTLLEVGPSAATPVWVTLVVFGINHFIEMRPPAQASSSPLRAATA